MEEYEAKCEKCGLIANKIAISKHQDMCDIIPVGEELNNILNDYSFLSIREIADYLFYGITEYFLKERLVANGWTRKKIIERNVLAHSEKSRRGMRQYGEGARDKFRARCLRCDILINHEMEMDLRFCKYCYSESHVPSPAFERYFAFTGSDTKLTTASHLGLVSYGYDPSMLTYFAYVRPDVNPNIVILSIGNSPKQCATERVFRERLINSGLYLSEVDTIVNDSKKKKREPTTRESNICKYLIEYISLCNGSEDDEEDE